MEKWKEIPWYDNYQVSNLGNIRSLNYNRTGKVKILKNINQKSYSIINLYKNNKVKRIYVHRLVAQSFLWLNIDDKKVFVCHKSENLINWLLNNSYDNLFLWNALMNTRDMNNKGRSKKQQEQKKYIDKDNIEYFDSYDNFSDGLITYKI